MTEEETRFDTILLSLAEQHGGVPSVYSRNLVFALYFIN